MRMKTSEMEYLHRHRNTSGIFLKILIILVLPRFEWKIEIYPKKYFVKTPGGGCGLVHVCGRVNIVPNFFYAPEISAKRRKRDSS